MVQCAVYGCRSNNNKNLKRNQSQINEQVKFFKFPREKKIEEIWVEKCGRKDTINVKTASICSKHFSQDSYVRNLQHELLNYSPKSSKKLKPDAIPSEKLPFPEKPDKQPEESAKETGKPSKQSDGIEIKEESKDVLELMTYMITEPSVPPPLKVHKSTNTEGTQSDEDTRLLKAQAELKEVRTKLNEALIENAILKKELDILNEILTPQQRKMLGC